MSGWVFEIPRLVQIVPGLIAMVFNTALCFVLAGCALATRNVTARRVLAGLLVAIATVVWSQDFFRIDLGIDQLIVPVFLADPSPFPGRMAPQTCISFLLTAVTLFALTLPHRRALSAAIQAVTILIGVVGFVSLVGYSLQLELIYSWYRYTRMAVHTAGGFTVLALGLWLEWYRITIQAGAFDEHEDQRVNFIGGALIIIVAVAAGVSGFTLLAHHTERIAMRALQVEVEGQIRAVGNTLAERESDVDSLSRMLDLQDDVRHLNEAKITRWAQRHVIGDVAAISVYSTEGSLLARAGDPWRDATLDMEISASLQLLWRDQARVRAYRRITTDDGTLIGTLEVEMHLPIIQQLIAATERVSNTADLRICGAIDANTMQCLPTRLVPEAMPVASRTFRGVELPASLALRGDKGARVFVNFRGRNSVGSFGKIPNGALAFVMQQEAEETYAAIRKPLRSLLICLAVLVVAAIVLLRWQIAPLVRKTMLAKGEAAANATRIASIMNSVPDGIIMVDRAGNIAEINPAVSTLFGYTKDELLGQNIRVLMPQSMRPMHDAGFANYARTGERKLIGRGSVEVPALRKDGSEFLMQLSLTELTVESQRYIVGVMRDVTERKAAERLKDEFISVVSHELRTPLTSISGSLGLIAAGAGGELPPKAQRLVQIANQNSERLSKLINDILDLEKADGGKLQLAIEPCSVRAIVEQVIDSNQPYAQRLGVELLLESSSVDARVAVDKDRFAQVLTNIISNAAKFSPAGESVRIRIVAADAQTVRVDVSDHGPGIPEAFRGRMFQKFAQADSSDTRAKGGTGLGLSIAKSLIESMQGTIGYETSTAGTTFHVTVPAVAADGMRRERVA